MTQRVDPLRHYVERLAENPDWIALRGALERERDVIIRHLASPALDTAGEAQVHALRGELRGLDRVLAAPRRELAKHTTRQQEARPL